MRYHSDSRVRLVLLLTQTPTKSYLINFTSHPLEFVYFAYILYTRGKYGLLYQIKHFSKLNALTHRHRARGLLSSSQHAGLDKFCKIGVFHQCPVWQFQTKNNDLFSFLTANPSSSQQNKLSVDCSTAEIWCYGEVLYLAELSTLVRMVAVDRDQCHHSACILLHQCDYSQ